MGFIQITIFVPKELEDKAKKRAEDKMSSMSQVCREALAYGLNKI